MTTRIGRYVRRSVEGSNFQTEHCDECNATLPRGRTFAFFVDGAEAKTVRFLCVRCHRTAKGSLIDRDGIANGSQSQRGER